MFLRGAKSDSIAAGTEYIRSNLSQTSDLVRQIGIPEVAAPFANEKHIFL
jgi:hypothetical protein